MLNFRQSRQFAAPPQRKRLDVPGEDRRLRIRSGRTWQALRVVLLSVCLLLGFQSFTQAQPEGEEELPTLEQMVLPSVEELLNNPPRDWVVLNTGGVLTVESLIPRPDTLKLRQQEIEATRAEQRQVPPNQREPFVKKLEELDLLYVTLPDVQGNPEFRLPLRRVVEIIHHEDLMIRRIDALLKEGEIEPALELLNRLRRTWDDWPGMQEAHVNIVYADARKRIDDGNPAVSLMLLDEVYRLNKNVPGLAQQAGRAIQSLVEAALSEEDYLRAQYYLNWIQQRFANHSVYQTFSQQLSGKVTQLLQQADTFSSNGDLRQAALIVDEAARIWPLAPTLRGPHRTHSERYQRLQVGVVDLPGQADAYFARAHADRRHQSLTELTLFELDRIRDGTAYYRTRFFDEWEPTDLNREMKFTLKQFRQPFEMQAVLTTGEIVPLILARLNPSDPQYDERLAAFISSVEVHSPTQFSLVFRRVPPRIEPLLANITVTWDQPEAEDEFVLDSPGGFRVLEQSADSITYVRNIVEPPGLPKYRVAEIHERRYDSYEKATQALYRGEISMIPDLPDWIIRRLQSDEDFMKKFYVAPYQMPETHLLQFNPASQPLRSRELRTALAYAVDRPRLLREIVLRDPNAANGKIVATPFLSSNPGRNILVEPRRYDLSAALAMLLASRKQLPDGIPTLTMIVAPGPVAEDVAREIAATWKKVGVEVQLIYAHEPRPEHWDIILRSANMVEPLVDIWPFLTIQDRARLADLRHYPDWLKQELVQLDRTSDQSRAISALQTLHRHLWSDTSVFPLWELQRYMVVRRNVQEYPRTLIHCYDQIDRWTIDAWYQTELP